MGQPPAVETDRRSAASPLATARTIAHAMTNGRALRLTIRPDISPDTADLLIYLHDRALRIDQEGYAQLTSIAAGQPARPGWDGQLTVKPLIDLRPKRQPERVLLEMIDFIILHAVVAAELSDSPFPD